MASSRPWHHCAHLDHSAVCEAFRVHRDALLAAVTDVLAIVTNLSLNGLVSPEQQLGILQLGLHGTGEDKTHLFEVVQTRIKTNPDDFPTLLDVLYCEPHLRVLSERIWSSYLHCKVRESMLEHQNYYLQ